jgi:hypothetical protein
MIVWKAISEQLPVDIHCASQLKDCSDKEKHATIFHSAKVSFRQTCLV